MLIVAAIWYMCDQHEPSEPFLLELDCPETPTKAELAAALIAAYRADAAGDEDADEGELELIVTNGRWGLQTSVDLSSDIQFPHELIIGLPERLGELRSQFPDYSTPPDA